MGKKSFRIINEYIKLEIEKLRKMLKCVLARTQKLIKIIKKQVKLK